MGQPAYTGHMFVRTLVTVPVQAMTPITVQTVARTLGADTGDFEATLRALVAELCPSMTAIDQRLRGAEHLPQL